MNNRQNLFLVVIWVLAGVAFVHRFPRPAPSDPSRSSEGVPSTILFTQGPAPEPTPSRLTLPANFLGAVSPGAPSPSEPRLRAAMPARASHPLVDYPSPGRIRSFRDPELRKAYDLYFSLIGPAKAKYPYAQSGFDTEPNAALAVATVQQADYTRNGSDRRGVSEASVQAITHLAHSELPGSRDKRLALSKFLIDRIERSPSPLERAMREEDLRWLLVSGPRATTLAEWMPIYQAAQTSQVKGVLASNLYFAKTAGGETPSAVHDFFRQNGIEIPAFIRNTKESN